MRGIRAIYLVVALTAAGCSAPAPASRTARLIRGQPFEPDIPVPSGFAMVERASEDRSTGSTRLYLRHMYAGTDDKYAVREFYREQMPLVRWTKVADGNIKGNFTMRFEKGDESCTISIFDGGGMFSQRTHVEVVVSREEQGAAFSRPRNGS